MIASGYTLDLYCDVKVATHSVLLHEGQEARTGRIAFAKQEKSAERSTNVVGSAFV